MPLLARSVRFSAWEGLKSHYTLALHPRRDGCIHCMPRLLVAVLRLPREVDRWQQLGYTC